MNVKLILPALTEATSPLFRSIKYSLFPPLGLATLAAYLGPDDEAGIYDEPGQVLSVALTRTVAQIFQRQDLRNLMLEDDIRVR